MSIRRRARRLGAPLALTLLLGGLAGGGCTLLQKLLSNIRAPSVTVNSVEPELKGIADALLHFDLSIINQNPVGLKLAGIGYNLDVEGREVARGATRGGLTLEPRGRSSTQVDVQVPLIQVASSLLELLGKSAVQYRGQFNLKFDTPIGELEVPVAHSGELPLPKKPPVIIKGLRVGGLNTSGVTLVCDVDVENPNPFDLPIDKMALGLKVNNRELARASAPRNLKLAPRSPLAVPIEVKVSFADLGLSVADLVKQPRLNYAADLDFASGPLSMPISKSGNFRLTRP